MQPMRCGLPTHASAPAGLLRSEAFTGGVGKQSNMTRSSRMLIRACNQLRATGSVLALPALQIEEAESILKEVSD